MPTSTWDAVRYVSDKGLTLLVRPTDCRGRGQPANKLRRRQLSRAVTTEVTERCFRYA